jgi:hypothetical protein
MPPQTYDTKKAERVKRDKEMKQMYSGLAMIGAIAVLWIGVVWLMAETHKNARPLFIVLGCVISVGLAYAWYDFNEREGERGREREREGERERHFIMKLCPWSRDTPDHLCYSGVPENSI